jgi:hypothetical protein
LEHPPANMLRFVFEEKNPDILKVHSRRNHRNQCRSVYPPSHNKSSKLLVQWLNNSSLIFNRIISNMPSTRELLETACNLLREMLVKCKIIKKMDYTLKIICWNFNN